MLDKVKLLLDITNTNKDALLSLLIENATNEAMVYTHNDDVDCLANAIIQMVVYQYNRLDTLGVDSEGYSGVSFNYTDDYPEGIVRMLRAKRRVIIK